MIYTFSQNNSGGYYAKPAQHIIVKDARDAQHAVEIALKAGMYFDGVADGVDCDCCGDRWHNYAIKDDTLDRAVADAALGLHDEHNSIPKYVIVDDLDIDDTVLE